MMKIYFNVLFSLLLVGACSSLPDKKLLQESEAFKLQIEQQLETLRPALYTLRQRANSINIQGRALSTDEIELIARVSGVEQSFFDWEQQYERAQVLLKEKDISATDRWNGYQQSYKELTILQKRIHELLN